MTTKVFFAARAAAFAAYKTTIDAGYKPKIWHGPYICGPGHSQDYCEHFDAAWASYLSAYMTYDSIAYVKICVAVAFRVAILGY